MPTRETLAKISKFLEAGDYSDALRLLEQHEAQELPPVDGKTRSRSTLVQLLRRIAGHDEASPKTEAQLWEACGCAHLEHNSTSQALECWARSAALCDDTQVAERSFALLSRCSLDERWKAHRTLKALRDSEASDRKVAAAASKWMVLLTSFFIKGSEAAVCDIKRATELLPDGDERDGLIAQSVFVTGQMEEPAAAADRMIKRAPNPYAYFLKLHVCTRSGDKQGFLNTFREGLSRLAGGAEILIVMLLSPVRDWDMSEELKKLQHQLDKLHNVAADAKPKLKRLINLHLTARESDEYATELLAIMPVVLPPGPWRESFEAFGQQQAALLRRWNHEDFQSPEGIEAAEGVRALFSHCPLRILEEDMWLRHGILKVERLFQPEHAGSSFSVLHHLVWRLNMVAEYIALRMLGEEAKSALEILDSFVPELDSLANRTSRTQELLQQTAQGQDPATLGKSLATIWQDPHCVSAPTGLLVSLGFTVLCMTTTLAIMRRYLMARAANSSTPVAFKRRVMTTAELHSLMTSLRPYVKGVDLGDIIFAYCGAAKRELRLVSANEFASGWKAICDLMKEAEEAYRMTKETEDKFLTTWLNRLEFQWVAVSKLFSRHRELHIEHIKPLIIEYTAILIAIGERDVYRKQWFRALNNLAFLFGSLGQHEEEERMLWGAITLVEADLARVKASEAKQAVRATLAELYTRAIPASFLAGHTLGMLAAFTLCQNMQLVRKMNRSPSARGQDAVVSKGSRYRLEDIVLMPFVSALPQESKAIEDWGGRENRRVGIVFYAYTEPMLHIGVFDCESRTAALEISGLNRPMSLFRDFSEHVSKLTRNSSRIVTKEAEDCRDLLSMLAPELLPPGRIRDVVDKCDVLVVVPFGVFHDFPFHWLLLEDQYLFESKLVLQNPTFLALHPGDERAVIGTSPSAVFFAGPGAPGADQHKGLLARYFPEMTSHPVDLQQGFHGNKETFLRSHDAAAILTMHAHFVLGKAPFESYFVLGGQGADTTRVEEPEALSLREVYEHEQCSFENTRLAVLSCCNTQDVIWRHSEAAGAATVFLARGVPSVLASLYPLDPEAARVFLEHFYAGLARGKKKYLAYHEAQKATFEQLRNDPRFGHPLYFSPWVLSGNPD